MNDARLFVLDVKNPSILSFDTKGNDLKTVIDNLTGIPDGIAVDPVKKHIYWTNMGEHHEGERFNYNDGSIERINFDGTNHTTIIPKGSTFTPKQMQIDLVNGFIYWSDREGMRVMRAKLDGSDITTLIETGIGEEDRKDQTRHCVGVAIDPKYGYIYWTQKGPTNGNKGRIFRAGLDLPPDTDAAQRNDIELLWSHLPEPIDLEIDHLNGMLYWTDRGNPPEGNTLNRALIDSHVSIVREIVFSGLKEGIGLALDVKNEKIYLTDLSGSIYSCDPDGTERRKLYAGDKMFTGIAYAPLN